MNTDLKGVKQWYKRLVESPMDGQEEGESGEKREKRENGKGGKCDYSRKRPGSTGGLILSILALNIGINWGWPLRFRKFVSEVPSSTTLRLPYDRTTTSTNGDAAVPGVALITCSLHCVSSWLKAPHLIPRPRYQPSDPRPTSLAATSDYLQPADVPALTGDPSISR